MRTTRWVVAATAALALAGTACSNGGSEAGAGATSGGGASSPSVMAPSPTAGGGSSSGGYGHGNSYGNGDGGGGGGGGGGQSGTASAVTVTQTNYQFTPSTPKVASGATITVKNGTSDTPHTFTVTGQSIDVTVDPGTTQDVKVDLPPGTYPFICTFHESLGMTGTLTVTK